MKKNYSRAFLSQVFVATLAVGSAPLVHADVASSSVVKPMMAKSYNRALDADLITAVINTDISKVRKLLARNADPNAKSADSIAASALCSAGWRRR